ncbi:hypothetical protein [Rhodococcus sp. Leaf233]|uniref:hypothetical protein n=1 Tax=Rhodococcus sp. Leaf233 TaxID=1736302 RepID=UPI000B141293|nr:hypothetical protein [Rhodococcus sp. Leaf233]
MSVLLAVLLIPVAVTVIVAACYGLYLGLQKSDAERALTYPLGSPERRMLEAL